MADPVIHVTNGLPDSGTGNITTLGQTLLDGANITIGAQADAVVAAGAAGTIGAKLRAISRDIVANIVLAAGANIIGVVKVGDGTNTAAVKAASTAPIATDTALVVAISPNSVNANGQSVMLTSAPVVIASNQSVIPVAGNTASGASDTDNPIKIGGLAKTANPTAVTDGQRVAALHDKLGKQVVVGAIRDLKGNQFTTITSSTSETTVVTAVASTFLDVYGCIIENTSATGTKVTFKDSTAGTTQFEIYVPPTDTRGFMLSESAAFKQTTVNTAWTATCGSSVASIVITMLYVKNL